MIKILGSISIICTGIFCYFIAHSIYKNRTRTRYKFYVKDSVNIAGKLQQTEENRPLQFLINFLRHSRVGRYCLAIAALQTRMRALCGRASTISETKLFSLQPSDWQRLLGFISGVCLVLFGILVLALFHNLLLSSCTALLVLFFAPTVANSILGRMKNRKRTEYERALPEMLSVIVLSVQAGATFDTAFEAYASRFSSSLAREAKSAYELYISQVTSRGEALDTLAREVDSEPFYHFVATVKRALYLGSPLGIALENQLRDMREYREERIKEEIAKKPVQILLPLGVFILPGMLILLLGPILMEVMQGISMQ